MIGKVIMMTMAAFVFNGNMFMMGAAAFAFFMLWWITPDEEDGE